MKLDRTDQGCVRSLVRFLRDQGRDTQVDEDIQERLSDTASRMHNAEFALEIELISERAVTEARNCGWLLTSLLQMVRATGIGPQVHGPEQEEEEERPPSPPLAPAKKPPPLRSLI